MARFGIDDRARKLFILSLLDVFCMSAETRLISEKFLRSCITGAKKKNVTGKEEALRGGSGTAKSRSKKAKRPQVRGLFGWQGFFL